jgi:hypothetical protein
MYQNTKSAPAELTHGLKGVVTMQNISGGRSRGVVHLQDGRRGDNWGGGGEKTDHKLLYVHACAWTKVFRHSKEDFCHFEVVNIVIKEQ